MLTTQDKNLKLKLKMYLLLDQMCYRNDGVNFKGCGVPQEKYNYIFASTLEFYLNDIQSFHSTILVKSL